MPKVTLIVTQRERFSFTQPSLESIYHHTNLPFELIYVDGNSPNDIRQYLAGASQICNEYKCLWIKKDK